MWPIQLPMGLITLDVAPSYFLNIYNFYTKALLSLDVKYIDFRTFSPLKFTFGPESKELKEKILRQFFEFCDGDFFKT